MSFPHNPPKSAAGIIVDPKTLERVVPESKRTDGTVRKELKIRPGFTPVEDIGRYRPIRASTSSSSVPGSQGRTGASAKRDPYARDQGENLFRSDPTPAEAGSPSSRAGAKNAKRREKKRAGDGDGGELGKASSLNWDEDDAGVERVPQRDEEDVLAKLAGLRIEGSAAGAGEGEGEEPLGTGSKHVGGGAPVEGIVNTLQSTNGAATPRRPVDPMAAVPAAADVPEEASQLVSPEKTEKAWKAARPSSSSTTTEATSGPSSTSTSNADRPGRWQRGGAPPAPSRNGGGGRGGSGWDSTKQQQQPERVSREVRVREGTPGDGGSLASTVRGLLVQNEPRARKTAAEGGDRDGAWRKA